MIWILVTYVRMYVFLRHFIFEINNCYIGVISVVLFPFKLYVYLYSKFCLYNNELLKCLWFDNQMFIVQTHCALLEPLIHHCIKNRGFKLVYKILDCSIQFRFVLSTLTPKFLSRERLILADRKRPPVPRHSSENTKYSTYRLMVFPRFNCNYG